MALPSNDKIVGDLGHTADHNAIVDEITFIKENYLSASGGLLDEYLRQDTASATYAIKNSPIFTGTPTAPTAPTDNNTTQIATTAFVLGQASSINPSALGNAAVGNSLRYARANHVHPTTGLGLTSGTLAQFSSTTSSQLAGIISDETGSGSLVFANSPTLLGIPVAPTASVNTNTSQIATTGFVVGQAGTASPLVNGTLSVGTSLLYSRQDHVHPTDTTRAPLNSPAFTGTPTAPTAASATNNTQVATTAFVRTAVSNLGGSGSASSVSWENVTNTPTTLSGYGITDALTLSSSSNFVLSSTASNIYALKNSAQLTGVPTAPTASAGSNTTQIATTEFVTFAVLQAQTGSAVDLSLYLTKDSASATYAEKIIDILSSSSSYTLSYSDINRLINISSSNPTTLTIPSNSSVPFPIGTKIDILQSGSGQVTASAMNGVTINGSPGLKLSEQWAAATVIKLDTDSWVLIGNITS